MSESRIEVQQRYTEDFNCFFDLTWYPFDSQECQMYFSLVDSPANRLNFDKAASTVAYIGEKYLIEYRVERPVLHIPK